MVKTRIEMAREAFKKNDFNKAREAHQKGAIIQGIHHEPHTKFSLSDIILGGQDGLVNVLGVILGVAAASSEVRLVLAAGFAAAFAESVSMGAVAYTSTISDLDHYQSELKREMWEIEHFPKEEAEEIKQIYILRGFKGQLLQDTVKTITGNKKIWLDVMMEEELKLTPIEKSHAFRSAFIVGISAIIGSIIPLLPFLFLPISTSIPASIILAAVVLFIAGVYKAKVTIGSPAKSGLELMFIGIVSALVGYLIGSLFKATPTT
ncbi:VIT1/CCC1 transporter family protein [Candidatus Gottesmanbacteria bacterium]|nr:VIT1/CCC1 transporter family protein [Candidatus Gottesmanbacteria bacterium]